MTSRPPRPAAAMRAGGRASVWRVRVLVAGATAVAVVGLAGPSRTTAAAQEARPPEGTTSTTVDEAPTSATSAAPAEPVAPSLGVGTTTTTEPPSGVPDEGRPVGTTVSILIAGLLAVALGLVAATWWYVRATRPVPGGGAA